ncbi:hypothetical protein SDC9_143868 [bioreactor metagenome]|uniref:Uncharacterized protein n=1 Tax=bioreactor metagenome TaxID=1076179 RepID=A0A645E799_9ZZZZ
MPHVTDALTRDGNTFAVYCPVSPISILAGPEIAISTGAVSKLPLTVTSLLATTFPTLAVTVVVFLFNEEIPPASRPISMPFSST